MHHVKCPPVAPLREIAALLDACGIEWALGGSALLAALELEREVRDWDLTTDASMEEVLAALAGRSFTRHGPQRVHADEKVQLENGQIELIVRMALAAPGGVVRIPTLESGRWEDLPVGSPEAWAVAYALMGRAEKSSRLLGLLERRGASAVALERLAREPLPADLAEKLGRLPVSPTSSTT